MADFDWKKLVGGLAPTLGTALGGPLAGMAIKVIADKLLGNPDATETEVSAALAQGLSPEQIVALKAAENVLVVRMRELDIDVMKVNQAGEQAYIADASDARHTFGGNENVFVMGCIILGTFSALMALVLTGLFLLMSGRVTVDQGTLAVCAGIIGTIIGALGANAQQVVSFFFGSSKGSKDNGERIGAALTASIKASSEAK